MTNSDPYLAHQNALRPLGVGVTKNRLDDALDAMNYTELRNAARRALIANAYQHADPEGNPEHESYADDHLMQATTFEQDQERITFREEQIEAGHPDDIAEANWYRRLLNLTPLDPEGDEIDPKHFAGWDA